MKTLFILITFFLCSIGYSQIPVGKISGTVKSQDNKMMEGATVSLRRAKDSVLSKTAVSNKTGQFEIEKVAVGKYILNITAVGFARHTSKPIEIDETTTALDLGMIQLKDADKNLANVTVTSIRPLIENKIDKTVVNVDAVTNIGTTAMDVLEKSPGISVDRDGNISLKGKQGVIILMDGKPTYLGGQDLANYLRNMPSGQLDQIEIMSQPSARFDASGNSGVINIKTKKNNLRGLNGSVSATYTQGVYPKSSNSFNINSRKGRINVFANASYSYFKGFEENSLYKKFHNQSTKELTSVFDQNSYGVNENQPYSIKGGIDFLATDKTTIGIVLNSNFNTRSTEIASRTNILSGKGVVDSVNQALTTTRDPWHNYSGNFNLRHVIDKKGQEITADIDYAKYVSKNQQHADNYSYSTSGSELGKPYLLRGNLPSNINIYSAKVDYVHPLKKEASIEAGWKSSYVTTDNNALFTYFEAANNKWAIDPKSNHFIYKENINAAYVSARKQMKKWGMQLGLRVENTNAKGNQITNKATFNRHYTQLFPTAYVSYNMNKKNTFGLSYGRRVERPNYQDLNPFRFFLDQYTYMEGNPLLTPQFSHNIEVSHNYKGQLNTSLNYTRTTDIISKVIKQNDSSRTTFLTRENIASRRNIGLAISYNKPITKYWTVSAFANAYNNFYTGAINNAPLKADYTAYQVNLNNQFRFNKIFSGEISGFYRSKDVQGGTLIAQPMGSFSLGGSMQIMKTKGTLRLGIRDPFYLQKFRGYTLFDNIDFTIKSKNDTRQVSLAFVYRFAKNPNNIIQRKRSSASQDEQNRAGGN